MTELESTFTGEPVRRYARQAHSVSSRSEAYVAVASAAMLYVIGATLIATAFFIPHVSSPAGCVVVAVTAYLTAGALMLAYARGRVNLMLAWVADMWGIVLIVFLCAAYVAVGILKGWTDFANYLLALWIRVRVGAAMQMDLFRHLLGLSMRFFTPQRGGELVSRLTTDTSAAAAGLETIVGTVLSAPVLVAVYGYLLVRTSPRLVMAALGAILLHYSVTRFLRGPIRRLATDQFSAFAHLAARFQEAIASVRVVKSFGAERYPLSCRLSPGASPFAGLPVSSTYGALLPSAAAIGWERASLLCSASTLRVRSTSAATTGSAAAATVSVTEPSESVRSITHSSASSGTAVRAILRSVCWGSSELSSLAVAAIRNSRRQRCSRMRPSA